MKKVKNDDVVLCNNNVKVFIDPKSIMTIIGTTMDYIETDISSEFTFINPKSKGSCGCGERGKYVTRSINREVCTSRH